MSRHALLAHFGSLRSTLALFALLGAVVLARPADASLVLPLAVVIGALALNLLAALVVHPAFRRRFALLVAHLALLAVAVLVGLGRLMALDGRFELTEGVPFDGTLIDRASGPLHRDRLQELAFRHEGFEIDYAPGRRRGATRNRVVWQDADGTQRQAEIGDHRPLVLLGHRITTSPNKGFAPVLAWTPTGGEVQHGAVHLPSFPVHETQQSRAWALPDGREAWVLLQTDETLIDPQAATRFEKPRRHHLVVRVGSERAELVPGQTVTLAGGTLRYVELRTWMGYRIAHDPTLPWLLAASLLAALALGLHYLQKFGAFGRAATAGPALAGAHHG